MGAMAFGSSVIVLLLILLNGCSIALAVLPFAYGPIQSFQIFQLAMAAGPLFLSLLLFCCVVMGRKSKLPLETFTYAIVFSLNVVASVLITLRWVHHELHQDYDKVPKMSLVVILTVCVSWAATLIAVLGFFLTAVEWCAERLSRARTGNDPRRSPQLRHGTLPMQPPFPAYIRRYPSYSAENRPPKVDNGKSTHPGRVV